MAEHFPNLADDITLQIQETELTPNRINIMKPMPNITVKLLNMKDQEILKAAREMTLYLWRKPFK